MDALALWMTLSAYSIEAGLRLVELVLVWPVAAVIIVVMLRKPLTRILDGPVSDVIRRIKRLQAPGGLDAEIGDQVDEIQGALADEPTKKPDPSPDQGQQLELTVTDQVTVTERPTPPAPQPRTAAEEVSMYIDQRLIGWRGYLQAMERYVLSEPRTTMVSVWEDGRRRIRRDLKAGLKHGLRISTIGSRDMYPGTYPESWHEAYERSNNVHNLLLNSGDITANTAREYIASVDNIYERHLHHLADAMMLERSEQED